jgi:O-antigen ligase
MRLVIIGFIIADAIILSILSFISPLVAWILAILTALAITFMTARLGYVYFLILWLPYEGLILPESGGSRILRLITLVVILILAYFKFWLAGGKIKLPNRQIIVPILAFMAWSGITIITASQPLVSLFAFSKLLTYLSILIMIYNLVESEKDFRKILYFSLIALLPIFVIAAYQFVGMSEYRAWGIFGTANTLGVYSLLGSAMALLLYRLVRPSTIQSFFAIMMFIISLMALLFSGARASILGFMFFIVFYLIFNRNYRLLAVLFLTTIVIMIHILTSNQLLIQFARITRLMSGTTGRTILWDFSLPLIRDHLVFGVGLGGVPEVFGDYIRATNPIINHYLRNVVEKGMIHNGYLQKTAELGLAGIALLLWANIAFIKYLLINGRKTILPGIKAIAILALALLIGRLAHSIFESAIHCGPLSTEVNALVFFTAMVKTIDLKNNTDDLSQKQDYNIL